MAWAIWNGSEIRNTGNYVFYDSPVRLLRLGSFKRGWVSRWRKDSHRNTATRERRNWRSYITREELLHELRQGGSGAEHRRTASGVG